MKTSLLSLLTLAAMVSATALSIIAFTFWQFYDGRPLSAQIDTDEKTPISVSFGQSVSSMPTVIVHVNRGHGAIPIVIEDVDATSPVPVKIERD